MTLKTKIAIDALKAAFTVSGLPAPVRNEVRLVEFLETGTPGFRWRLAIIDGDWTTNQTELGGDGPGYEMSASMQVAFMVEGEAGDARDAIFDAGVEVLSTCLPPNTTLGGAVESLDLSDEIVREHYILDNAPPVEAITLKVDLNITAPTKFG